MSEAKEGDRVSVHYTGTLESGEVFDTSEGKDPLEFSLGKGDVIEGFDSAVIGMKEGEEKEKEIPPEKAYGQHRDELIQKIPKKILPEKMEIQVGTMLLMKTPDGQSLPAKIVGIEEDTVQVDLNPPLAGKKLKFKIKLEKIL